MRLQKLDQSTIKIYTPLRNYCSKQSRFSACVQMRTFISTSNLYNPTSRPTSNLLEPKISSLPYFLLINSLHSHWIQSNGTSDIWAHFSVFSFYMSFFHLILIPKMSKFSCTICLWSMRLHRKIISLLTLRMLEKLSSIKSPHISSF